MKLLRILAILTFTQLCHAAEGPQQKLAAQQEETITLFIEEAPQLSAGRKLPSYSSTLAAQRHTFVMPRDVARQAQTLAHTIDEFPNQKEFPVGTATTPAAMNYLAQIMQVMHRNNRLEGKELLDVLEREIAIDPAVAFDLLRTANYLDLQPAIEFVARVIAKNSNLIKQLEGGFFRKQTELPHEILTKVAWYNYLINIRDLKGVDTSHFNYSIQDYLDHNPNIFYKRKDYIARLTRLNLSNLKLKSLKGLGDIPNISTIEILDLSYNNLSDLESEFLTQLTKLLSFNVSHNKLTQLITNPLQGIAHLFVLDLSFNRLTRVEPEALISIFFTETPVTLHEFQFHALTPRSMPQWGTITGRLIPEGEAVLTEIISGPYLLLNNNALSEQNKKQLKDALVGAVIKF